MIEYRIIYGPDRELLSETATTYLNEGWNLAGGISISTGPGSRVWFAQALTKEFANVAPKVVE